MSLWQIQKAFRLRESIENLKYEGPFGSRGQKTFNCGSDCLARLNSHKIAKYAEQKARNKSNNGGESKMYDLRFLVDSLTKMGLTCRSCFSFCWSKAAEGFRTPVCRV